MNRRTSGPAAPVIALPDVLRFLNDQRLRATYGAVAQVLQIPAVAIGGHLGDRRPEASWVVSSDTGLPTGYSESECHPDLFANSEIVRTANDLLLRLAVWRKQQPNAI